MRESLLAPACLLFILALLGVAQQPDQPPAGQTPPAQQPQQQQQTQKVAGLELVLEREKGQPPESAPVYRVEPAERFVNLRARTPLAAPPAQGQPPPPTSKLLKVKWVVLSTGRTAPKVTEDLNSVNDAIIIGLPEPGESLFVAANAMVEKDGKNDLTDHASVQVVTAGAAGAAVAQAQAQQNGQPVAVPAGVRNLSVIVVVPDKAAPEYAALARSPTLANSLAGSGSKLYLMDMTDAQRRPRDVLPHVQRTGTPALLVVSADGQRILPAGSAQRLNLLRPDGRNDAEIHRRNELIILDLIGRAAGGR